MFIEVSDITNYINADRLAEITSGSATITERAVEYANSLVKVSLEDRYDLPLIITPGVIKDIALTITKYKLYEYVDAVTDDISNQYKLALSILNDFTTGKRVLSDIETSKRPTFTKVNEREQIYTKDLLDRY